MFASRARFASHLLFFLALGHGALAQTQSLVTLAGLRPHHELRWQRVSPSVEQPDGPVLYQLVFSASGTPGTVPAFDTNPRHLTNSPIAVSGGNVVIGGGNGLNINGATGIISFAAGQTFPGTGNGSVTSVATGAGLTGGPITTTGTVSIANSGVTTAMIANGAVTSAQLASAAVTDVNVATGISYSKLSGAPTSLPPNGSAGGSLTGTYPNPTIASSAVTSGMIANGAVTTAQMGDGSVTPAKINSGAATNGQVLTANGSGGATYQTPTVASPLSLSQASATPTITGANSGNGNGVNGTSSTATGIYGNTAGVSGLVNGAAAVLGDTATYFGVWGASKSNDGVHGSSDGGYGVVGTTNTGLTAVYGKGGHIGVFGQTLSADDSGVLGRNDAASATPSQAAPGIFGFSTAGWGVLARGDDAAHGGVSTFSQNGPGIVSTAATAAVSAGIFNNLGGGKIFSGQNNGVEKIFIDGNGSINGGLVIQPNVTSPNVIGGFSGNNVTGGTSGATIGGGGSTSNANSVTGFWGTVSGGGDNTAGQGATVIGGRSNTASGTLSTVAGGITNTASGQYSFVAGGNTNTASGFNSFAAGFRANANADGTFVFATGNANTWSAFGPNRFQVLATGGATFDFNETAGVSYVAFNIFVGQLISTSSGAFLTTGGVWTNASDRNLKTNFEAIDPKDVLNKVAALPIRRWKYKVEPDGKKHIGPMAQDFYAAFALGDDDKHIGTVDEGGVALAAIQGLNQKMEEEIRQKDAQIAAMEAAMQAMGKDRHSQQVQIEALQQQMHALLLRLATMEKSNAQLRQLALK